MTQYVINIGALPNDGTGDPLRTAFNETNLNFDQVFAAGPVLSNVRIANNTILTTNTNGNLVLAPNGIGVVQSNVSIVPNTSNIRNLGSGTQRWSSLYVQYANISGNLDLGGIFTVGDLVVTGNLTVTGNTIQIGNLITDAKTIQLANTAASANAANGSGMTVGANDNIATLLYSNTANAWTTNIGVSVTGNVAGNYFIGNGSQLTGVTASGVAASALTGNTLSSNVLFSSLTSVGTLANLSVSGNVLTGGLVSAVGNITGNYILGNISQASGFPATYGNSNVATFLSAYGSNTISTTGNVTVGNILPSGYVSATGNVRGANFNTDGTVSAAGNVTGNYFIGNGSQLTSLPAPTVAQDITSNGAMSIMLYDGNIKYNNYATVEPSSGNITGGNISATGNITADYFIGDGSQLSNVASTGNLEITGTLIEIAAGATETSIVISPNGPTGGQAFIDVPDNATANTANLRIYNSLGNIELGTNDGTNSWYFDATGTLTVPGAITSAGDTSITATDDVLIYGGNKGPDGGEGGDVFIDGGDGADDNGTSVSGGGDIELTGGAGGDALDIGSGGGGQINLTGGVGGAANNGNSIQAGAGGRVIIKGGSGGDIDGNIALSGLGGNVNIYGGDGSFDNANSVPSGAPGDVNLFGGNWGWVTPSGNINLNTYDGTNFKTLTYDIAGNVTMASGGALNFVGSNPGIVSGLNEDFYIRASDDEADGWSIYNVVDDGAGNILSQTRLEFDQYTIRTGAAYTWAFRDTGVLELPGDIYGNVGGNLTVKIGDQAGSDTFIDLQTRSYVGDALISNIRIANPNVTVSTANAVYNWTFDSTGNLNLPPSGNLVGVTANNSGYINWLGNSSGDLNGYTTLRLVPDDTRESSDQYLIVDPTAPGHIHIRAGGTQDNSGADLFLGGENSYFRVASGANSAASVSANSYVWTYGTDGTFSLPAAESPGQYSEITSVGNSSGDGNGYATLQLKPDASISGDSYLIIDPTAPNHIHIRAGGAQDNSGAQLFLGGENSYFLVENGANSNVYVASNSNQWKFDTTGILTLPGEGVLQSLNDTVTLSSLNTTTGNANSVYLGSSGGLGFSDQAIGGNWLEIFRSGSDPEIRVPPGGGNILITGASGSGGAGGRDITITAGPADQTNYYTTTGGTVNITGGLGATDDGGGGGPGGNVNITAGVSADPAGNAGNVNITAGSNDWILDNTGNLTVPGNIVMPAGSSLVGNGASPAPNISGFNSATFGAGVTATGNITGGNILTAGLISATGNVTAGNFIGTSANVTLVAGSYSWTFDNTGNLTIPAAGDILLANTQSTISAAGNITAGNISVGGATNISNVTINSYTSVPQLWFKGTLSTDQSLTTSNDTIILYNTNTDPLSWGNVSNGHVTPTKSGWYEVVSRVQFSAIAGNTSAQINHQILVNGLQQAIAQVPNSAGVGAGVAVVATAMVNLNGTTDYITTSCYTTVAGQTCVGSTSTMLLVKWVST